MQRTFLLFFTCILFLLSACSTNDDLLNLTLTEEKLYEKIQIEMSKHQYTTAIDDLQALEARFPFGIYAEQAQLELIYAYYMSLEPEAAISTAERFIRLHPQHPKVDYALYMKGLTSFTEGKGLFERFLPTDLTQRDPGAARRSFADFSQLLARYPNSIHAADAKKRMVYLRNLLARHEIHIANYYFSRNAYLAAANRGRYVIENFQRTPAVPDALATMVQAYKLLGLNDLADEAELTLKTNFPEHIAFNEDGEFVINDDASRSWLNSLTFGLIDSPDPMGFDSREKKH